MREDKVRTRKKTARVGRRRRRPALWQRALGGAARLGLWSLAALLVFIAFNKAWRPYGLNRQLQRDLEETRAELASVQEDNARQMRRIENLKSPRGQVAAARRFGYHLPGEVPLRLQEPKQAAPPAPPGR